MGRPNFDLESSCAKESVNRDFSSDKKVSMYVKKQDALYVYIHSEIYFCQYINRSVYKSDENTYLSNAQQSSVTDYIPTFNNSNY